MRPVSQSTAQATGLQPQKLSHLDNEWREESLVVDQELFVVDG
jgi:hypothetical protein